MRKMHSVPKGLSIWNTGRTRCGINMANNTHLSAVDEFVTCKRCLIHMEWERTGNKIIIVDNETE